MSMLVVTNLLTVSFTVRTFSFSVNTLSLSVSVLSLSHSIRWQVVPVIYNISHSLLLVFVRECIKIKTDQ